MMSVHRLTAQNGSHVAVALNSSSLGLTGSPNVEYATKMVAWPSVQPLRYFTFIFYALHELNKPLKVSLLTPNVNNRLFHELLKLIACISKYP